MVFEPPNLAIFRPKHEYRPKYGDLIVDSGIITTKFGFVIDYTGDEIEVISSASLMFLVTGNEGRSRKARYDTDYVVNSKRFTILQNEDGNNVWFT